jgi:hypothetical protein
MIHDWEKFKDVMGSPGLLARFNPLRVIRAASYRNTNILDGQHELNAGLRVGMLREVLYIDEDEGIEHRLTLKLVEHANATALTNLGDTVYADPFTPLTHSPAGRIYAKDGTLTETASGRFELHGVMFGEYFDEGGGRNILNTARVPITDIQPGDRFWVIVKGPTELLAGADVAAGAAVYVIGSVVGVDDTTPTLANVIGIAHEAASAGGDFIKSYVNMVDGAMDLTGNW